MKATNRNQQEGGRARGATTGARQNPPRAGQLQGSLGEPFILPDIDTLEVRNGMPILPRIPGRVITMEMVKELCED